MAPVYRCDRCENLIYGEPHRWPLTDGELVQLCAHCDEEARQFFRGAPLEQPETVQADRADTEPVNGAAWMAAGGVFRDRTVLLRDATVQELGAELAIRFGAPWPE